MESEYSNKNQKSWQERNADKYHYDRHYTSPEELLEINAREQKGNDGFHYDRHYYDAEENFMLNQKSDSDLLQFEEHHASLEEYFGGPSDLTEKANEKREEFMRKKMQREEAEKKFKESQKAKQEYERFQSLPMGQKLYEVVYFYGKNLAKNPSTVEMSKKIFAALSDFRNLNFDSMHDLFEELKNSNDNILQEAVPYWEELLAQCEEAIKKQESSKFTEVKEEYKKSNMFSKFIARFQKPNAKVDENGKKR